MNRFEPWALTTPQIDALRRVAADGAAMASEAMTVMTRRPVVVMSPTVQAIPITRVADLLGGAEALVAALHMRISGAFGGEILVALSPDSAEWFLGRVLERRVEPAALTGLTRLEESVLLEIGNTLAGAYLNALSDRTGRSLLVSIPEMAIDMAGAVVDDILAETTRGAASMLLIEMTLAVEPDGGRALMLHMPESGTLRQLVAAFCAAREDERHETAGGV